MPIRQISQQLFNSMQPARKPLASMLTEEKAWYTDSNRIIAGAVLFDKTDEDWSYVVLGPDQQGSFRWITGDCSFETQYEAASQLRQKMDEIVASGETVFPQR